MLVGHSNPAEHDEQPVALPVEYWGAVQVPVTAVRPLVAQYDPAGHGVHADVEAPPAEKDPAEHCAVGAPSPLVAQYDPAVQDVHEVDPAGEKVPAKHCTGGTAAFEHCEPAGH